MTSLTSLSIHLCPTHVRYDLGPHAIIVIFYLSFGNVCTKHVKLELPSSSVMKTRMRLSQFKRAMTNFLFETESELGVTVERAKSSIECMYYYTHFLYTSKFLLRLRFISMVLTHKGAFRIQGDGPRPKTAILKTHFCHDICISKSYSGS